MAQDPSKEVARFADVAMYDAEPLPASAQDAAGRPVPKVHLLSMTPDPLGAIAAACKMYEGKVVRSIAEDVTDEERRHYFEQVQRTHLQAPFEFVDFHFLVEGVTRSFTHQMVRQRTAVYAQESLRFAVKDSVAQETALPPSLVTLADDDPRVVAWVNACVGMEQAYEALIGAGVPAEDARGLLPHNITTRLHYKSNLRGLMEHAGNRLCTQAQFEWRLVWMQMVKAIREYRGPGYNWSDRQWQYDALADVFRPICYLTGKCEFKAQFDRACSIRDRVEHYHMEGLTSEIWGEGYHNGRTQVHIEPIRPEEWLLDPSAARVAPGAS